MGLRVLPGKFACSPVGEVVCDELVVVVVDRLAEDPSLAEADRVLSARLDDRVDNRLHLVLRSVF